MLKYTCTVYFGAYYFNNRNEMCVMDYGNVISCKLTLKHKVYSISHSQPKMCLFSLWTQVWCYDYKFLLIHNTCIYSMVFFLFGIDNSSFSKPAQIMTKLSHNKSILLHQCMTQKTKIVFFCFIYLQKKS